MKQAPYLAIADRIRSDIARRSLAPHARLPSESKLVERFRVARATVRRALALLQDERLIYSRTGAGSFVAEPRVEQDLDQLFSFTEFMVYRGLIPGSRILEAEIRAISEPGSPVLHNLHLKPGARVVFLRRLRLGSGQPLVVANTWLPESRFSQFLKHDFRRQSVYEIMDKLRLKPTDAIQTIESVTLDADQAALLTTPPGSAALLIRRAGYCRGIPVEYAEDYYRGDRTTFRVRLGVLEQRLSTHIRHTHLGI
ncbi:MAG TPA: GntR family transcriptional regulator [Bryobacteraceae bacterium]|nr:GntR family transcriptional regulator [Bryobacteraceae bacterium]